MSRIGLLPIDLKEGVNVEINSDEVVVKGKLGELRMHYLNRVKIIKEDNLIKVSRKSDSKEDRSLHGLYRSLINNMVTGVSEGYSKELSLQGIGYRVALEGEDIVLNVGYSHTVKVKKVDGIKFEVFDNNQIKVSGIDKQLVGQVSADIRKIKKPEPYKGKGIRYKDEVIIKKAGKSGKATVK
ncbi:MAG: 50S ribosomal protein L6 [Patescibacteria group bacterium]